MFLITLKCGEAQDAWPFSEIVEIGKAKEPRKNDEEPAAQTTFVPQLQRRRGEEESNDDDGEERTHRVGRFRIAGMGSG